MVRSIQTAESETGCGELSTDRYVRRTPSIETGADHHEKDGSGLSERVGERMMGSRGPEEGSRGIAGQHCFAPFQSA
jgi:hypothetical protein